MKWLMLLIESHYNENFKKWETLSENITLSHSVEKFKLPDYFSTPCFKATSAVALFTIQYL